MLLVKVVILERQEYLVILVNLDTVELEHQVIQALEHQVILVHQALEYQDILVLAEQALLDIVVFRAIVELVENLDTQVFQDIVG